MKPMHFAIVAQLSKPWLFAYRCATVLGWTPLKTFLEQHPRFTRSSKWRYTVFENGAEWALYAEPILTEKIVLQ